MRILVATDQWFPDRMGGVARVATDTARGWAAKGHEVVVIAPRHEGEPEEKTSEDGALRLLRVLPRGRVPQTLSDPGATRRWALRLAGETFDVVVAHCSTTACGLLSARLGRPLVYIFHADAAKEARYLREQARPGRLWLAAVVFEGRLRRLTRKALNGAADVIVLSDFSRRILYESSPAVAAGATLLSGAVDTSVFTPAGREEARAQLGVSHGTRLVFTVRRFAPRMGLENLVMAVWHLEDLPDLRVAVAGGGNGLDLAGLRDRLGLEDRVDLLGRVSDRVLTLWHRAADLFVLPTVAYEGFGLVTAEALASGTPVVGTRVGATPELLEPLEPRLLAHGTDPEDLAEAIRTGLTLATPELRARCREYALARLSWDTLLPDWERVLENAARGDRQETGSSVAAALGADRDC
jgi:glycosyltransferase involved in cell wall biosynthesis